MYFKQKSGFYSEKKKKKKLLKNASRMVICISSAEIIYNSQANNTSFSYSQLKEHHF